MHVPSYPPSTSSISQNQMKANQEAEYMRAQAQHEQDVIDQVNRWKANSPPSFQNEPLSPNGHSIEPETSPEPAQAEWQGSSWPTRDQPAGGASRPAYDNCTPPLTREGTALTPRTASDWARDQEQFAHMPPLPEGWIRVKSRNSGTIYYCCKETGETTFVEPTAAKAVSKNSDLPAGWIEMASRNTGRKYYWNTVLKTSQLEKPTVSALSNGGARPEPPKPGNDNEGLPEGWVSMVSRSTNKNYYFNAKEQKSQYDRPTEFS